MTRWIYDENGRGFRVGAWRCSNCKTVNNNIGGHGKIDPLSFRGSLYCPQCGKRMDGQQDTVENALQNLNTGGVTMEKIETVQKKGLLNEVYRVGEQGPGGAYHTYAIVKVDPEEGENPIIATIKFQKGPRSEETSRHGILDHELIEIVLDRIKAFQKGKFAADQNWMVIFFLEQALKWMNARVEDRIKRGVLGLWKK